MVMQPMYGKGIIESQTIEISQEGLRPILAQIEAELIDSEVYRRTMAGLQTMLGEASSTAQILVKAVGREAVRLTFQEFARHYKVVPVSAEGTNKARQQESNSSQIKEDHSAMAELQTSATSGEEVTNSVETTKPPSLVIRAIGETKPLKKLTKAQMAAQMAAKEREEVLRQLGQELRQARQTRSLSVRQLHNQTLVPEHHIEALEIGRLDQLPEDVYIRGFIRRVGQALGLDGMAMAASLPAPDPVKSVVPSWYNSASVPEFHLNSVHLYLGYTALIAGAVGGLSWMSNQSTTGTSAEPKPAPSSQASVSPKVDQSKSTTKPGLKSSKTGGKAGPDIAPPEALPF